MNSLPFRIKICGVKTREDAMYAHISGAQAIGFNFYPHSKRFLTIDEADNINSFLRFRSALTVGVFVNPSVYDVVLASSKWQTNPPLDLEALSNHEKNKRTARRFDWIQFHGNETPEFIAQIKNTISLPIMCAFRWGRDGGQPIEAHLASCAKLGCVPDAVLIDSSKPGEFGGTGETADWGGIARWRKKSKSQIPLVLAGGLNPSNVEDAIAAVQPDAVDTASGVEAASGQKDPQLVKEFVERAKRAFAAIGC